MKLESKQALLFLTKKKQKNSARLARGRETARAQTNKSLFGSFSSEKELLALLLALLLLTGCGRKGAPNPPGPATEVTYPQTYPSQ